VLQFRLSCIHQQGRVTGQFGELLRGLEAAEGREGEGEHRRKEGVVGLVGANNGDVNGLIPYNYLSIGEGASLVFLVIRSKTEVIAQHLSTSMD